MMEYIFPLSEGQEKSPEALKVREMEAERGKCGRVEGK